MTPLYPDGTIATGGPMSPTKDGMAAPTPEEQRVTDALYDGDKAPVPVDPGDFYGHSMLTTAIDSRAAQLWEQTGAGAATQQHTRNLFAGILKTTGLPEPLVASLAEHYIDGQLAAARPADDSAAAAQALAQQITSWNAEARTATFSGKDGELLLKRVEKFVQAHPDLQRVLQQPGLGSRPDILAGLASHVFSTGYR